MSCITDRFDQPGYAMYQKLETLLLKAANRKDFSTEIKEVLSVYGDDFNEMELSTHLEIFGTNFDSEVTNIHDILKFFSGSFSWPTSLFATSLLHCAPDTATNASERSFSVMRRLKSYLRSTMSQPRLNHLMVLSIYKELELLDDLDLNTTAYEFVSNSEHRPQVFGTFDV